jgi:cell division protein FtsQ
MTTNLSNTRSEAVRRKRTLATPQTPPQKIKKSYRPETIHSPIKSKATGRKTTPQPLNYKTNRRHYDIGFSTPNANIRTPGITLPSLGPRLVSGILLVITGLIIMTMWNSPNFQVSGAQVSGNLRISEADINAALLVIGKPIFSVVPAEIELNLLKVYPGIASVDVQISLPNQVIVNISERIPAIAWQRQDGSTDWIDANGIKFSSGEQMENLVTIVAYGDPPTPLAPAADASLALVPSAPVFIEPSLITTITDLVGIAPQGAVIIYDPAYGLGWIDPRGWLVYLGENTKDVTMKLNIYQAIIDKLSQEGVQPTMISVEYLDAPFYRTQ